MSLKIVEHNFTGPTTPYTAYDSTKTILGKLIQQRTGVNPEDNFAGPMPLGLARPMEASTAIAGGYPHVYKYSDTEDYVFLGEISTALATRRIVFYKYNKLTSVFTWKGYITLTYPPTTIHTIRGFRVVRELYTSGTASVSGTAVTGTSTAWNTDQMSVGCRIGFGSIDPTQITTWYEISAVNSDTSITLTTNAGTVTDGPYVIEDLSIITSTSNATTTNGGLFIAKGIRVEIFNPTGTTIPAATTIDRRRAVYWLADASTVTNTISCGVGLGSRDSWTQQYVYVIDGTGATCRVYKYNIRAALGSLAAGKSTSAFVLVTGAQLPTGAVSQANNGRIDTLYHGAANGIESLYFVTATRVYRATLSGILSGDTNWQSDAMVEVPPGGTTTFLATNVLSSIEIASTIDRLIVMSTGSSGARSYVTKYNTNSDPLDHIFLTDDKQQDQSQSDSGGVSHPAILATAFSVWAEDGIAYLCRLGTTAALNQMYTLPIGAHWTYAGLATSQRLITPAIATPNADTLVRIYVNRATYIGDGTFGLAPEPLRAYYRLSGIDDDTGSWVVLDDTRDLSGITGATHIQLMFEFKTLGTSCIPARVFGVAVVYEDNTTDSHFQPSVGQSSLLASQFAWRFSTAFGQTVPTLRVRLYDAVAGGLLIDDNTAAPTGTFEKSIDDGQTWAAYNTTDKTNDLTYIRYTPASLASNIKVRALLTLN